MKRAIYTMLAVATLGVASQSAQAQWVVQPTTVWSPVVVPGPVMQPMVIQSGPVFAPAPVPVTLAAHEHLQAVWLPWREAAARCFSWSNREAIEMLPQRTRSSPRSST